MFGIFKKKDIIPEHAIVAVADGNLIPLEKVADPVFSQKMLGDGIAIIPKNEIIVAPCNGTITMIYPTLHAFGIINDEGVEILIHIGINTVNLNGKGFKQYVGVNDEVKAGDKVISFYAEYLIEEVYDFTTIIIFPDCHKELIKKTDGYVRKGKDVVVTYK